jgi:hypothetical protein
MELSNSIEEIWRNIDRKCRNEVTQGKKRGAEIIEVCDKIGINECFNLYLLTLERQEKKSPISREIFIRLANFLLNKDLIEIYI